MSVVTIRRAHVYVDVPYGGHRGFKIALKECSTPKEMLEWVADLLERPIARHAIADFMRAVSIHRGWDTSKILQDKDNFA